MHHHRDQQQDEEDEEQDFGNAGRSARNAAETENRGNDRDDEKRNGPT